MCDPISMSIAMGATKALQVYGQRQATKAQFGALANQRDAQNEEIAGSAGRKMGERVKQGRAERSRLRVAAGEAGVTGQSFEAQMMDAAFQEDFDLAAIGEDTGYQQRASEARFKSGLASVRNPGMLESGLQIATASAGGYATGLQIKNAKAVPGAS